MPTHLRGVARLALLCCLILSLAACRDGSPQIASTAGPAEAATGSPAAPAGQAAATLAPEESPTTTMVEQASATDPPATETVPPSPSPADTLVAETATAASAQAEETGTTETMPTLQEYDVPRGSRPHDVAPAPDGTVWYTAQAAGSLGRLDPDSGETDHFELGAGSAPHGVTVGPDGAPWITDSGLNAIVRVDPVTHEVRQFPLPAEHGNANLNTAAFDRGGILWFTGQNGFYGRLDPGSGAVEVWQAPRGRGPYGITVTPDGQIYYASLAGSHIARIDAVTGAAEVIEPPTAGQGARRVWSDSRGRIWVSEWNAGQLGMYDPATKEWREWPLPGERPQAYAVYVDDQDIVWLSDFRANAMVRFDPATEAFEAFPLPTPGAMVRQILGRPGEVWGAESATDKLVVIRTAQPAGGGAGDAAAQATATSEPAPPTPTADPWAEYAEYTIEGLRGRSYGQGEIEILQVMEETPSFTRYLIAYPSDGLRITGMLNRPKGDGPFPAVILNHGYYPLDVYQTGNGTKLAADYLAARGFLTISPDFRSHAGSDDAPNLFRAGHVIDVLNLIPLVQKLPYARPGKVGMWGHSNGGAITAKAMVVSDQIGAALIYAPASSNIVEDYWFRVERAASRGAQIDPIEWPVKPEEGPDLYERLSPLPYLQYVQAPVQIHWGTADETVPLKWPDDLRAGLEAAGKQVTMHVYEGQPHSFQGAGNGLYLQRMVEFFAQHLLTPTQ